VAAAVTRLDIYTGASPILTGASYAGVTAEGGIKMNREDTLTGTTPIPIPTATGTNYSWIKNLALDVTTTGTTNISNRRIYFGSAPSTGLFGFYKSVATGSYAQAASGNLPAASGSNGATPAGYTALATSLGGSTAYDASSVASSPSASTARWPSWSRAWTSRSPVDRAAPRHYQRSRSPTTKPNVCITSVKRNDHKGTNDGEEASGQRTGLYSGTAGDVIQIGRADFDKSHYAEQGYEIGEPVPADDPDAPKDVPADGFPTA
jgi:hypothetical protein